MKLPSSSKTHTRCVWVVYTFGGRSISLVNGQREWNPIENGLRPTALTFILLSVYTVLYYYGLDSERDGVVRKIGKRESAW